MKILKKLKIKVTSNLIGQQEKLELETNENVKKILNFLNDDFLEGIVSEKPFLSSNKRDI